jgi:hypothetical protein
MPAIAISPQRRDEILDALRRGTVPASSLDILPVGLEPFEATLRAELDTVRAGRGTFKAVRGEYGSGKTFFARWFEELARREGFATSMVGSSRPKRRSWLAVMYLLLTRTGYSHTPTYSWSSAAPSSPE